MTIDEAIQHCEEVANGMTAQGDCKECAEEHRQLAEWLKELKHLREVKENGELPPFEVMAKEVAEMAFDEYIYKDKTLRKWIDVLVQTQWIPIKERLPENDTLVLVTIKVGNREPKVRSGYYYRDGFFHIDNGDYWKASDKELLAWMPLPEPYKAESQGRKKLL